MVKRDFDDYLISETGNWNTAADFSKIKIMRPLEFCDIYENIAIFGFDSFLEQLDYRDIPKDYLRVTGFERLVKELLKIIGNCKFAMKKTNTKAKIEEFEAELERVWNIIPSLHKTITNNIRKTSTIKLIQPRFDDLLKVVLKIKSEINFPLNFNHLIFTNREEPDPAQLKAQVFKSATERG